ncbi:2'-5' RNA ligase family protein [Algoriphagus sediminis]|uniref:2'-5' RNA ligase family protein n=1 Tax=Algoriphagus sediminis TaxID=3057113 RepID=A0ABT7YBC3_9BACT|nr:2'-5' RNA ligase family protein [Algoriphagus sediminis]MDN3203827.1 2'-5' RNA ligase family protein [Algoriphagus sediminis]
MGKYFLAFVPEGFIQERGQGLKELLKTNYGVKYALKSPVHITVKMPFTYNEKKELTLIKALSKFSQSFPPFKIKIHGVDTFSRRVIFWDVEAGKELLDFQSHLKTFCKRELNLVDELSDRNYHPHMTIAFKDLKEKNFDQVLETVKNHQISEEFIASQLSVLKRNEGRWVELYRLDLGTTLF